MSGFTSSPRRGVSLRAPVLVVALLMTFLVGDFTFAQDESAPSSQPTPAAETVDGTAEITTPTTGLSAPISLELARSKLQGIEANTTLDAAQKARAADTYRQIVTELEAIKGVEAKRAEYAELISKTPDELKAANERLEQTDSPLTPPQTDEMSQDALDNNVSRLKLAQDEAQKQLEALKQESARRAARRLEITDAISAVNEARLTLQTPMPTTDTTDTGVEVREARALLHDVQLYSNQLQSLKLQEEQAYYEATASLLPKQIELMQRRVDRANEEVRIWTAAADAKRQAIAQQDKEAKESKAAAVPDELKKLADHNLRLAQRLEDLAEDIAKASSNIESTQQQLRTWKDQFERVQGLIDVQSGVSESVGGLLREQRTQLPNLLQLHATNASRQRKLYEIRSERFSTTEELLSMVPLDRRVEKEIQALAPSVSSSRLEELRGEVRTLLEEREKTLNDLRLNYDTLLANTSDLNIKEEELIRLVQRYTTFIDQRVLWIPSIPPLGWSDVKDLPAVIHSVPMGAEWSRLFHNVIDAFKHSLLVHLTLALLFVLMLVYRQTIIRRLQALGELASSRTCRNINTTIKAALWTFMLSALGPAVLLWISFIFAAVPSVVDPELAPTIALAARRSALVYWPISFWLHVVRRGGLAEDHFGWHEHILRLTRRQFSFCIPTLVPAAALFYFFQHSSNPHWQELLARLTLMFASVVVTQLLRRLMAPSQGIPHEFLAQNRDGWLYRLRYFWYGALVATPLTILLLSGAGYLYTAQRLSECLYTSTVYVSGIYLVWSLAMRWSLLNRRAIAIAQARERLAASSSDKAKSEGAISAAIAEQVDLVRVNEQTNRLLTSFAFMAAMFGIYLVWINVLPALERLNQVRLWPVSVTTAVVSEPTASGDAVTSDDSVSRIAMTTDLREDGWITLGNLASAVIILI
ncbi:MAG: hypothetical protein KDB23_11140, partial [Planctomycetales bacterium]|nr:hypothetical protein [Planctomycetales bacterium]